MVTLIDRQIGLINANVITTSDMCVTERPVQVTASLLSFARYNCQLAAFTPWGWQSYMGILIVIVSNLPGESKTSIGLLNTDIYNYLFSLPTSGNPDVVVEVPEEMP